MTQCLNVKALTFIAVLSSWASYTGASISRPSTTLLKLPLSSEDRSSARSCRKTGTHGLAALPSFPVLWQFDTVESGMRCSSCVTVNKINTGFVRPHACVERHDFTHSALPEPGSPLEGVVSGPSVVPHNWAVWPRVGVAECNMTHSFCSQGLHSQGTFSQYSLAAAQWADYYLITPI